MDLFLLKLDDEPVENAPWVRRVPLAVPGLSVLSEWDDLEVPPVLNVRLAVVMVELFPVALVIVVSPTVDFVFASLSEDTKRLGMSPEFFVVVVVVV